MLYREATHQEKENDKYQIPAVTKWIQVVPVEPDPITIASKLSVELFPSIESLLVLDIVTATLAVLRKEGT